jgi:hypothetical protein
MALQAAAEGHSGISNWARSQLVRTLGKSTGPELEPVARVGVVEPKPSPNTPDGTQGSLVGVPLITDDEMKSILDDVLQGKG